MALKTVWKVIYASHNVSTLWALLFSTINTLCICTWIALASIQSQFKPYCIRRWSGKHDHIYITVHVVGTDSIPYAWMCIFLCLGTVRHPNTDYTTWHKTSISGCWAFLICYSYIQKLINLETCCWSCYTTAPQYCLLVQHVNHFFKTCFSTMLKCAPSYFCAFSSSSNCRCRLKSETIKGEVYIM